VPEIRGEVLFSGSTDELLASRRALMTKVTVTLKLATTHELTNAALHRPIEEMIAAVNAELQGGDLQLQAVGDNVFINQELVKVDYRTYEVAQTLRTIMKRLGVGEISFKSELSVPEARQFLEVFQQFYRSKTPTQIVQHAFPKIGLRPIKARSSDKQGEIDERQNVLRTYAVLTLAIKQQVLSLSRDVPLRAARIRRAIHGLADATVGHESLLIGLTRHQAFSGELWDHLAAVTGMCLLMGRRMGLHRVALSELCVSAALHDIGRANVRADEGAERQKSRTPLLSVLAICSGELTPEVLGYARTARDIEVDASSTAPLPSAIARVIAVPCAFDLLVAPGPGARGVSPDRALRLILDRAGARFDPAVARLFAAILGLYPIGTTVRLSSGELAIVMEVPSDFAAYDRPVIKVIRDAGGPSDRIIDLAQQPGLSIVESVDPVEERINPAHFLFA
jgi:HD-GYP domain-containing protein (c-di-GMP phosphodiesterase class II)